MKKTERVPVKLSLMLAPSSEKDTVVTVENVRFTVKIPAGLPEYERNGRISDEVDLWLSEHLSWRYREIKPKPKPNRNNR